MKTYQTIDSDGWDRITEQLQEQFEESDVLKVQAILRTNLEQALVD